MQAFGNKLKLRDFVNIWMVEDRVQDFNCNLRYFSNIFLRQFVQSKREQQNAKQKTTKQKKIRNFT